MEKGYAFENLGEIKDILLDLSDNLDSFSRSDTFSDIVTSQFAKIKKITKEADGRPERQPDNHYRSL